MFFISCNIEKAYSRVLEREKKTKRHTSREMVEQRAGKVNYFFEKYKEIVDEISVYDTTTNEFVLQK